MKNLILILLTANLILGCSNTKKHDQINFDRASVDSNEIFESKNKNYIIAKQFENNDSKLYTEYLLKASTEGDPIAQNELANNYAFGNKVEENSELFRVWAEKSALQGYTLAQLNLGTAYYLGVNGLKQDNMQAKKWLEMAAKNGDDTAKKYLEEINK